MGTPTKTHSKTPAGRDRGVARRRTFSGHEVVFYLRGSVRMERFELLGFRDPAKPRQDLRFVLFGAVLVVSDGDGVETGYSVPRSTSLLGIAAEPTALTGGAAVITGSRRTPDRATMHHAALRVALHRMDRDRRVVP